MRLANSLRQQRFLLYSDDHSVAEQWDGREFARVTGVRVRSQRFENRICLWLKITLGDWNHDVLEGSRVATGRKSGDEAGQADGREKTRRDGYIPTDWPNEPLR